MNSYPHPMKANYMISTKQFWEKETSIMPYNIPTMQLFTGISKDTQSKSYTLSLTHGVWDFQNNALWDSH